LEVKRETLSLPEDEMDLEVQSRYCFLPMNNNHLLRMYLGGEKIIVIVIVDVAADCYLFKLLKGWLFF
jgi:hypothetical protein